MLKNKGNISPRGFLIRHNVPYKSKGNLYPCRCIQGRGEKTFECSIESAIEGIAR